MKTNIITYSSAFCEQSVFAQQLFDLAERAYQFQAPWTVAQFFDDLYNPYSHYLILLDENQQMVGYLGFQQLFEELEITNLVVAKTQQKQGLGKRLLSHLEQTLAPEVEQLLLEVRVSNLQAQNLYLRREFEIISRRVNYYQHPVEDALIMLKKVGTVS